MKKAMLFLKLFLIGGLALVILIALFLVESVISSRQEYRDEALKSISASYASEQRILGPFLVQPYRVTTPQESIDAKGVKKTEMHVEEGTYTIFPKQLVVKGELKPSIRRHGLYRVPVYEFDGTLSGHFDVPPSPIKGDVQYGIPYLAYAVKDARGIVGLPVSRVDGTSYLVVSGSETVAEQNAGFHAPMVWGTNLRTLLPAMAGKSGSFDVTLDLALAGTRDFDMVPLADSNHFELASPWAEPLFAGSFLPRSRDISPAGFHAQWDVSSLASATQHQLLTASDSVDAVSVTLADAIDPYRLADRAVKYGILFVILTFVGFFLFELVKQMLIHPVQYLLVGFCLAVFFLLLVSFSEHMPFALAYLISSAACIGLLTYYLAFVLKSRVYGLTFGAILATLYAAIYGLLISEDNALLLGSLLLFGLIAVVMIATRKVDWYQKATALSSEETSTPKV